MDNRYQIIWAQNLSSEDWLNTSWYLLGIAHAYGELGNREIEADAKFLSALAFEHCRQA